jgi:imidazolonepropionase-like amidohydrolase
MKSLNYLKLLIATSGLGLITSCTETKDHDLLITNTNIVNVETGEIEANRTVAINGDTIAAIYSEIPSISDSTQLVDGTEKYLIPGLWDMHVHHNWNYEDSNPLLIANGVTGIREMWGNMLVHKRLQRAIVNGTMDVPDIYTGSVIIDGNPKIWPGSIEVSTSEEAVEETIKQIESGVDFLKVYSMLSRESFNAIAKVANENNIPFAGHVPNSVSIYEAMEAGMVSSEHLYGILESSSSLSIEELNSIQDRIEKREKLVSTFDESRFDSLSVELAQSQMWLCPTLTVNRAVGRLNDSTFTNDDRLEYLPDIYRSMWSPVNDFRFRNKSDKIYTTQQDIYNLELSLIGKMNEKGVKFLAGTDFPNPYCFPGFSLHDELSLLVEGGLSELDALRASTLNPAVFMEKEDQFGTIEIGKTASLVLLAKNPLDDIAHTKEIEAVLLRGKLFNKSALSKMLENVKLNLKKPPYSAWLPGSIARNGVDGALDSLDLFISAENSPYRLVERDINMMGYQYLNYGDAKTAVKIFEKNVQLFPESPNVYDSYGEALMADGRYQESIENYQKVLDLDPEAYNARKMLDSLKTLTDETKTNL